MDELDSILLQAWNRIGWRVKRDRMQALKRSRRRFMGVLTRPMREWCLVIRASDLRINSLAPYTEPSDGPEAHERHRLVLDGETIQELTKPVMIPWPGVTYDKAAKMLGRTYASMDNWVKHGAFSISYYREFKYPGYQRTRTKPPKPTKSGRREKVWENGRPYLWTPAPIDPNNFHGRIPHPVWGTLWQWLWERLPAGYVLEVERVPRFRTQAGKRKFMGWEFVCPGRTNGRGEYQGCGRRCTYLYGPQTVWTLAKAIAGGEIGFDLPEIASSGLALKGQWFPGASDPVKDATGGGRSFACKQCWRVRSACMANTKGWNEFISQISGGLLYGREVPRPKDICPVERKKRDYRWKKPHPRRRVKLGEGAGAVAVASRSA